MNFGNQRAWNFLLMVVGATFLWTFAKFTAEAFHYRSYSQKAQAKVLSWQIVESKSDEFKILATYQFEVKGAVFHSSHLFLDQTFHNRYAAEEVLESYKKKNWTAWYRDTVPPKSTLSRAFPVKSLFYAMISGAIFLYFFWLRYYLRQKKYF